MNIPPKTWGRVVRLAGGIAFFSTIWMVVGILVAGTIVKDLPDYGVVGLVMSLHAMSIFCATVFMLRKGMKQ